MDNNVYQESIPIFYILLAGAFILSMAVWKNGFFPMIGKPEKQLAIKAASLLVNAVLGFFLITNFGLKGAAISTFIVNVFFALLLNFVIKRELDHKVRTKD
jgi:O-antigen/teichoic acid export membrane protein